VQSVVVAAPDHSDRDLREPLLLMVLRINWNTERYQKLSAMTVTLVPMGMMLPTPRKANGRATRWAWKQRKDELGIRNEQHFDGYFSLRMVIF
jgi:hypothetical protein